MKELQSFFYCTSVFSFVLIRVIREHLFVLDLPLNGLTRWRVVLVLILCARLKCNTRDLVATCGARRGREMLDRCRGVAQLLRDGGDVVTRREVSDQRSAVSGQRSAERSKVEGQRSKVKG